MVSKFALIEAGQVVNIILADAEFAASLGAIPADDAAIGDGWDGAAFTPVPLPAPPVPPFVTMRQARLALLNAGLLAGVDAAIASLPEPDKSAARIEWEYAAVVQRDSGLVPAMAGALGMTAAQLDALFITAGAL